jgi:ferrochelatase
MAGKVAERFTARGHAVRIAFQSQGMDGGEWLGPDLPTTFAELAASGARAALVAPVGFVAEHVETLYDLDVEAPELARRAGLAKLARAAALCTRPRFMDALEAVARRALA